MYSDYSTYDRRFQHTHERRTITGYTTGCGNCVGYCEYEEHPGFLTKAQRKEHNCIKKECCHYKPRRMPGQRINTPSHILVLEIIARDMALQ